jgi:hypothetical protein
MLGFLKEIAFGGCFQVKTAKTRQKAGGSPPF